MKKKIMGVILCLFILVFLNGCGNKVVITTDTFTKVCDENGFETTNVIEQYKSYDQIREATVARNADGLQIEFYVIDSADNASSMFETNKTKFEANKGSVSSNTSVSMGNYENYAQTSNGQYMYVSRVDNTLIYMTVDENYKDIMKEIVKQLGY